MDNMLSELLDERRITALSWQFAAALDGGSVEDFTAVFTHDVDYRSGTRHYKGHAPLRDFFLTRAQSARLTRHLMTNLQVRFTGQDSAEGISQWIVFAGENTGSGLPIIGASPFLVADVRDSYLRNEAGWKIKMRHIQPIFQNPTIAPPVVA